MTSKFGKVRTCNIVPAPDRGHAECNIAVLGITGSGKSALTVKFLTKRFISEYDPNLEDTYTSEEIVDQQPVLVKLMDTADQDGPVNCERYVTWATVFLVVYSIDNRQSFEGCQQYLEAVTLHTRGIQPKPVLILVGNKLDMERYRQVSKSDGVDLASRYSCLFFEVSACLDFASVQNMFHTAVREARREAERALPIRPLFISEDRPVMSLASASLLTPCFKELPCPATAKLVTVKSSRAQSKRRAPTLTLLKGFKIF
ncbi:ras-like protein family member 12 isoform X1 [Conger conger]|uniref:ras-like protein family member 12 isoform X1 n=1 Tax=Conger conger TaxID=82655 RepID=UPI002A5AF15D|nr:ras-like protein family member 12 isoform X1 [Conger conger]XP_061101651.1 ras-like protein family member 12 isoform X1 [Conger conger]